MHGIGSDKANPTRPIASWTWFVQLVIGRVGRYVSNLSDGVSDDAGSFVSMFENCPFKNLVM